MDTITPTYATEIAAWTALVSFFLPILISVVNRVEWPESWKAIAAFIICLVAATGTVYFTAGSWEAITNTAWVITAAVTVAMARGFYAAFWRPTGLTDRIEGRINVLPSSVSPHNTQAK